MSERYRIVHVMVSEDRWATLAVLGWLKSMVMGRGLQMSRARSGTCGPLVQILKDYLSIDLMYTYEAAHPDLELWCNSWDWIMGQQMNVALKSVIWDDAAIGQHNHRILMTIQPWNSTDMWQYSHGTVLPCDNTAMGQYCHGTLHPWESTATGHYSHGTVLPRDNTAMGQYCQGTIRPWDSTAMGHYIHGIVLPRDNTSMGQYCHGTLHPWDSTATGQYSHGTLQPRDSTATGQYSHGNLGNRTVQL